MQTSPFFELLGWSALIKLYPETLRLLLSEEIQKLSEYLPSMKLDDYSSGTCG